MPPPHPPTHPPPWQTETPEQLAQRNAANKAKGVKQSNVVRREKVAVLSKGTLIDAEMVASRPDASYVMVVYEAPAAAGAEEEGAAVAAMGVAGVEAAAAGEGEGGVPAAGQVVLGLCAVDVASGHVMVGQFRDDEVSWGGKGEGEGGRGETGG